MIGHMLEFWPIRKVRYLNQSCWYYRTCQHWIHFYFLTYLRSYRFLFELSMVIHLGNSIRYVIFYISYDKWYILYHMRHINYIMIDRIKRSLFSLQLIPAGIQLIASYITIPSISDAVLEKSFKNFWRSSPVSSSTCLWLLQAAPNFAFSTEIEISKKNRLFFNSIQASF